MGGAQNLLRIRTLPGPAWPVPGRRHGCGGLFRVRIDKPCRQCYSISNMVTIPIHIYSAPKGGYALFEILVLSSIVGVVGTGLGGAVGLLVGKKSVNSVSYLLSFSAGVILSISVFDLIPEALEMSGTLLVSLALLGGVGCVLLLHLLLDALEKKSGARLHSHAGHDHAPAHDCPCDADRAGLRRSGLLMLCAVALHNLPAGVAIGSGTAHSGATGLILAVLIAMHNIPEGIGIGVPLRAGGVRPAHVVLLTARSGVPTLLGGIIGLWVGGISPLIVAGALALAAGAMLYVTFSEVLPQSHAFAHRRNPAIFTVIGVLLGFVAVRLLH